MTDINIELFSCAGGMAKGFLDAGIEFDLAFDFAADHVASYERNIGHRPIRMDVRDLLRMVRLGWRTAIGLFVADPPCTPWSRAGKRLGTDDDRDMLEVTCELIALLKPRRYLIGNVPGLDDHVNLPIVQRVIGGLADHGYCVADFARLDAADYGVPQHRVRPFWFGHLDGPCIRWPAPTHGDPVSASVHSPLPGFETLQPWVTCKDALSHLDGDSLGRPVRMRRRSQNGLQHGSVLDRPARVVGTSNISDGNVISYAPNHPPSFADEPAMTVRAGSGGGYESSSTVEPSRHASVEVSRGVEPLEGATVDTVGSVVLRDDHAAPDHLRDRRVLRGAAAVTRLHPLDIAAIADAVAFRLRSGPTSPTGIDVSVQGEDRCEKDKNVHTDHIDADGSSESSRLRQLARDRLARLRQRPPRSRTSPSSTTRRKAAR